MTEGLGGARRSVGARPLHHPSGGPPPLIGEDHLGCLLAFAEGGAHLFEGEAARGIGAVGILGGDGLLVPPRRYRPLVWAEGAQAFRQSY